MRGNYLFVFVLLILLTFPFSSSLGEDKLEKCIREYQNIGLSYEEARKKCNELIEINTSLTILSKDGVEGSNLSCIDKAEEEYNECLSSGRENKKCEELYKNEVRKCRATSYNTQNYQEDRKENKIQEGKSSTCEDKIKKIIEQTCLRKGIEKKICKKRYATLVSYECGTMENTTSSSCREEAKNTYHYCIISGRNESLCKEKYEEMLEECKLISETSEEKGSCQEKAKREFNYCIRLGVNEIICSARYSYVYGKCKSCESKARNGEEKKECWKINFTSLSCKEKMRKIIEETCLSQGIDEKICEERYNNLVKYECESYPEVVCNNLRKQILSLTEKLEEVSFYQKKEIKEELSKLKEKYKKCKFVADKCKKIKEKLERTQDLFRKGLLFSSKEEAEEASSILLSLKEQLTRCEEKERNISSYHYTIRIKDPCVELKLLNQSYENIFKKEKRLKILIQNNSASEEDLEELQKKKEFLEREMRRMQLFCKKGKETLETPCKRLAKLKTIYEELKEEFELNENSFLEERLSHLKTEIEKLKEICKNYSLKNENISSLQEFEETYYSKLSSIAEYSSMETLEKELEKIEKEKKELIKEFVKKMKELDLRKQKIINKLKIKKGEIEIEDTLFHGNLRLKVRNKDISLSTNKDTTLLKENNFSVEVDTELKFYNNSLVSTKSGKVISILPSEISSKLSFPIEKIKLIDDKAPKYLITSRKKGKLLGLFSIPIEVEYEISAETGEKLAEREPWWAFLVS